MPDTPPKTPMPWVWTCHLCRAHYPLGATRRCLEDGHYFCAGTSTDRQTGKIKKHNACKSEFDYTGWTAYGDWRRRHHGEDKPDFVHGSKDCSKHCDHPSECRWTAKRAAKSSRFGDSVSDEDKRSKTRLARPVKSAERRTAQLTDRLSPVEEEGNQSSSTAPKGLGLIVPALDFTGLQSRFTIFNSSSGNNERISETVERVMDNDSDAMELDHPGPPEPPVTVREFEVYPDDDTKDLDAAYRPSEPKITMKEFEFAFEDESQAYGQTSPTSPRRNAWDWSIGGIGAALTSADETEESESSGEEDVDMVDWK